MHKLRCSILALWVAVMVPRTSDSQAEAFKAQFDDKGLSLPTINTATSCRWMLLPDKNNFEVTNQFLFFVQTSAVAGCCWLLSMHSCGACNQ